MHRPADRQHQLVETGHALLRIDEQPLPVQAHHLHLQRLAIRCQRLVGIELVGRGPQENTENAHHHNRHAPGQDFQRPGEGPVGLVGCRIVAAAVAPDQPRCKHEHRDDHQQGQAERNQEQLALATGYRPSGVQESVTERAAPGTPQQGECDRAPLQEGQRSLHHLVHVCAKAIRVAKGSHGFGLSPPLGNRSTATDSSGHGVAAGRCCRTSESERAMLARGRSVPGIVHVLQFCVSFKA